MGEGQNGAGGAPPRVSTSPVSTVIGVLPMPEQRVVAITVSTPVGQNVYYVSPDAAEQIAANLVTMAGRARSGLVTTAEMPPTPEQRN